MMKLKTSAEEAKRLILSVPHKTCARAMNDHWAVAANGEVRAQSALWLFCWAKTGMSSEEARIVAAQVFDQVMPITFARFDRVVDHKYAREFRYSQRDLEGELEEKLTVRSSSSAGLISIGEERTLRG